MNHALNAFAFPSEAGTHLPTPDWRLSWSWVGGWLHIEINVLHREMNPDTAPISGAQRRLTVNFVDWSQRANHYTPAHQVNKGQR